VHFSKYLGSTDVEQAMLLVGTVQNKLGHFPETFKKYLSNSYVEHTMLLVGTIQNKLQRFPDTLIKIS
jgi:hypothetical protein